MNSPRMPSLQRHDSAGVVGLAQQTASLELVGRRPSADSLIHASSSRRPSAASSSTHSQSQSQLQLYPPLNARDQQQPQLVQGYNVGPVPGQQPLPQQQQQQQAPHSPTSVSSSGTQPWLTPREGPQEPPHWNHSPQTSTSALPTAPVPAPAPAPAPTAPAGPTAPQMIRNKSSNLPSITMPSADPQSDDGSGPRSAPVSSPLSGPAPPFVNIPLRSASSPDPRESSARSSPLTSPVEGMPPPSVAAAPPATANLSPLASHSPHSVAVDHQSITTPYCGQSQTGIPLPPRGSSFTNTSISSVTNTSISSFPNTSISSAASTADGAPTPRRSDTPTSTASSAHAAIANSALTSTPLTNPPKRSGSVTYCAKCGQSVRGQFVRALQHVYHLECFRCRDCDKVVAQKFFPVEDETGQYPLCERDYFARLNLICAKCDQALRASYITACGLKYHVEHFSCSVCDTVFGPVDSYYEHGGKVYCHYHYSISFANKCVGCETAILKQFVEINRNGRDECWHPECYMIHKFWNVRLASRNFTTPANATPQSSTLSLLEMSSLSSGGLQMSPSNASPSRNSNAWDSEMSADELKERQVVMELKVSQIWLVLSRFEETSAACIGEMLRVVNERRLLDVILLAERFILHVETLFAVIDDIEAQFAMAGVKGMAHAREAKQLCRKLVNFFSMLSNISPTGGPITNMNDLLIQVTQLAHYLKILIRIALTGAIKLDREQNNSTALTNALARLHLLSLDGADPTLPKRGDHPEPTQPIPAWAGNETPEEMAGRSFDSLTRHPDGYIASTKEIAYGYRSLAVETTGETTLRGPQDDQSMPSDGCVRCNGAIEDDCVRLGMYNRWHSACVECKNCGDNASAITKDTEKQLPLPPSATTDDEDGTSAQHEPLTIIKSHRRAPPARVGEFNYEPPEEKFAAPDVIWCNLHRTAIAVPGFEAVSRLEQFVFLLHVALRRLYLHFREHHSIPSAINHIEGNHDVKRVRSVTLDRKLSSTARLPQRSTVVESPAGRMADENGQVVAARDQTVVTPIIVPPSDSGDSSATVNVIRPPFARNNTSIRIVSETTRDSRGDGTYPGDEGIDSLGPLPRTAGRRMQEDDAITLSDIPMLANRAAGNKRSPDHPLMAQVAPIEALIVRHFALLALGSSSIGNLVDNDELLDLLDTRKNQWWNKLFKNNAKKDQKKKGIFGVPLEILIERTGSDSDGGASDALLRIPEFIEEITKTMRQMDMAIEGIFRKNGNIRRLQTLSDALDKDYSGVNLSEENPVQLAALLKRFLREMPDPLLTFRLHKLFCAAAAIYNTEERKRILHLLVTLLPKGNRDTLEVLFVFLRWVASFSYKDEETGSRMDLTNLATVICPSILYAKGGNAARDESFISIQVVQTLLENQDEFYRVPPELLFVVHEHVAGLFERQVDLPPKEIHKHCAKYRQARGAPPQRPSVSGGLPGLAPGVGYRPGGGSDHRSERDHGSDSVAASSDRDREVGARDRDARPREREPTRVRELGTREAQRDRPQDLRLSAYRSDGNLSTSVEGNGSTLRAAPSPNNTSRPTSWGTGPTGSTDRLATTGLIAMPTPQVNGAPTATSPGGYSSSHGHIGLQHPLPSPSLPGWRGPFQGSAASNGSRQSSRGSAPPSPGVPAEPERRSFQMERERSRDRSWTPSQQSDRQ